MTINTSSLDNWADTGTLDSEAGNLKTHGTNFKNAIDNAKSSWQGLSSCYDTPHADLLYSSLDVPATAAQDAATGAGTIADAITNFTATVRPLETERVNLLAKISSFESTSVCYAPGSPEETEQNKKIISLQNEVDNLASRYTSAVDTCVQSLGSIKADGTQGNPTRDGWLGFLRDTALSASGTASEAFKVQITRYRVRGVVRFFKIDFKTPWIPSSTSRNYYFKLFEKGDFKGLWRGGKGFNENFTRNLKESFLGPGKGKYGAWSKPTGGPSGKWFGLGVESTSKVKTGVSVAGRVGGRVFFVAGAALTYAGEYSSAQERLTKEHPELSSSQRNFKAAESSAVRGTAQIAAAAAAGAAAGSFFCPGVGTAVGVGVGLAMMIPTGGGKNLGDRIGDLAEAQWNLDKKAATGAWNLAKKAGSGLKKLFS